MCVQEGHYNYELGENISSRCEWAHCSCCLCVALQSCGI